MKKEEFIRRYGKVAWDEKLQQDRDWNKRHHKEIIENNRLWRQNNPEKAKAFNRESGHKGGKYYEKKSKYTVTGLQGERHVIRVKHGRIYRSFKQIIAPESQIHHEWIPNSSDYRGVALVEKDQHMYGYIDVIQILEGEITLLTEAEMKRERWNE